MSDFTPLARLHQVGLATIAAAISFLLATSQTAPLLAAELPWTETTGKLQLHVADTTGQPLPNAKIHVSIWTKQKDFKRNRDYKTDDRGNAVVELPAKLEIIRVWVRLAGHAPMFGQLWPQAGNDHQPLPKEFTYKLTKGTSMGGLVKNDNGQPIPGAQVDVTYESGGDTFGAPAPTSYDSSLADDDEPLVTDSSGRWSLHNVPPGKDVEVQVLLSHPDYINDKQYGALQKEQKVTSKQFRDQSATIVMHRGYAVEGRVTDADGKPVKNAVIIRGDRPYWDEGSQEVRTDDQGRYKFPPLPPGPLRITVAAKGWMPQMRKIEVAPSMPPVDFKLQHGKKLRIKFVDAAGKPIPKAGVSISNWRGVESLYSHRHPNVINLQVPNAADEDGIYEWDWAPDDAVQYSFGQRGFAAQSASLVADGQEHLQTLHPIFKITVNVTDAKTGKPIDHFRITPVLHFKPTFPFLERRSMQEVPTSSFNMEFDRTDIEHGVQIEAPGYTTFRTDHRYKVGEPSPTLDVRLQPAAPYRGTVVDANGQPVKGAKVYLATNYQQLQLYNLDDRDGDDSSNCRVTTDDEGNFEFVPQRDRYALVAIAPSGFAQVDRAASEPPGKLQLQPWARLQGRVVQDGKPIADHTVNLYPVAFSGGDQPRMSLGQEATSAADGTFTFERVPPVACSVRPFLHFSEESPLKSSRSMPLEPAPGSTTTLDLGGEGTEVTGQFIVDPPRTPFDYHFSLTYLVAKRPGINTPTSLASKEFDWRKGWSDSWSRSQEGQAYLNTLHHWFVKPDPDGKFRISGVPPGDYTLAINLYGTTEGCLVNPIAQRVLPISIPPDKPTIDLGRVLVPTHSSMQVGDVAANFDFKSPDGKLTDLTAQRGHYVLIDFWATWCGPCVANLPEVETLRKDFSSKGLIVVGANLDTEPATANDFLAAHPLPWHHAQLGDWSATTIPKQYGVSTVPAYILIDPQGRIAAIEYSSDKIREYLEKQAPKAASSKTGD